jgi:hypothetical protein
MAKKVLKDASKVEVLLAASTKKRFAAKAKKAGSSMSEVLRNLVRAYVKG